jgi:hypothetical protein
MVFFLYFEVGHLKGLHFKPLFVLFVLFVQVDKDFGSLVLTLVTNCEVKSTLIWSSIGMGDL